MNIELRAGKLHIYGYVNMTGEKSNPVYTPHGRVVETIMPGAFSVAIKRARNIKLTVDHGRQVFASTAAGTLKLSEDETGLYADAEIDDPDLIEKIQRRGVRGWSFGMENIRDRLEESGGQYPLRKVFALDIDHVTIVIDKIPVYRGTLACASETEPSAPPCVDIDAGYRRRMAAVKCRGRLQEIKMRGGVA